MKPIKIAHHTIGPGHPVFIIAEGGINHCGSMKEAKALIRAAKVLGADCIKFQKRCLNDLYSKKTLLKMKHQEQSVQYAYRYLKKFELSEEDFIDLKAYADEIGIMFSVTAFDITSFNFIKTLDLPFYKIGSPILSDIFLLDEIVKDGKPLIVSTGMSTVEEIDFIVDFLEQRNAEFALLHCQSSYPADFSQLNLRFIKTLADKYDKIIGWSGHEPGIAVCSAVTALGASIIEKHLSLDIRSDNPDNRVSLCVEAFKKLVRDVRNIEKAMGSPTRYLTRSEFTTKQALGKSLVAKDNITQGHIITLADLTAKSPGTGMSPFMIKSVIGQKAKTNIKKEDQITELNLGILEEIKDVHYPYNFGVVVRPHDIDRLIWQKPKWCEFHLTSSDLENHLLHKKYDCNFSFHVPEYLEGVLISPCSTDEKTRQTSIEIISRTIDVAISSKCMCAGNKPRIVFHPEAATLGDETVDKDKLLSNLYESVGFLKTDDADLLIENLPIFCTYFSSIWQQQILLYPSEMVEFCKNTGIGMCLDIAHAGMTCNYLGIDLIDYIKEVQPVVRHIHLADYAGTTVEAIMPGTGEANWKEIFSVIDYKNLPAIHEEWQAHRNGGYGFARAMLYLAEFLV